MKLATWVLFICLLAIGCGSTHPITTVEHTDLSAGIDGRRITEFPSPIVEALEWKNLSSADATNVDEEFQIAIYSETSPYHLFRISPGKKNPGEVILFWPLDGSSKSAVPEKNMHEYLSTICDEFERTGPYEYCAPKFNSGNDWGRIYSNLVQRNIWTLPDGSEIATSQAEDRQQWGMVFQIRKGMYFRTISHENPDLYNSTAEAFDVLAITAQLRLITNNLVPPINYNTYSGITNGLKGSAFIPCGLNEQWRFDANLTDLISSKGIPTAVEKQDELLFKVKVAGMLRDEWYANRRSTGYTKIITPVEISEVSVVTDTTCSAP